MKFTYPILFIILAFGGIRDVEAKEYQYGPTGIYGSHTNTEIKVTQVEKGSPADGRITPGMVIVGAGGANFKEHVRRELADAIDVAETKQGAGKLTLIVNGGKTVDLTLTVLGTYSDTAPYDCPKSAAILKRARTTGGGFLCSPGWPGWPSRMSRRSTSVRRTWRR